MAKLQELYDLHIGTCSFNSDINKESENVPFTELLRPRSFKELMLQDSITRKFQKMVDSDEIMNMIFAGRPAAGKTSASLLFEKNREVLRINAAINSDLSYIKHTVESYASTYSITLKRKLIVFDEADKLKIDAQSALHLIIEKVHKNCRFIFIVNDIKKLDTALISRCFPVFFDIPVSEIDSMIFKFKKIMQERLLEKKLNITDHRIDQIIKIKFPDFRAIANELEFSAL